MSKDDKKPPKIKYEELTEEKSSFKAKKSKDLKQKLKVCQKEKQEYLDGWQRAKADLINFRQRQEKQMEEWKKMINEGLILELLPVLDTLDSAIANSQEKEDYKLVKKQLENVLKRHGLEKIACQETKFNPNLHEIVEQEDGEEDSEIIEEISCGYKLNGKVIRTSKVKIIKSNNN